MLFYFKQQPTDFQVDEVLYPTQWSSDGSVLYLHRQKEELNTMDVISHLCEHTGLNRRQIGISGLKDKKALTTQWLSIQRTDVMRIGEKRIRQILEQKVTILSTRYADEMLSIGHHAGNQFTIRLRARESISQTVRESLTEQVQIISHDGFPNTFGPQRFGKRNIQRSKDFFDLDHVPDPATHYHLKLKLQAFPSLWFNTLAIERYRAEDLLLDGDILLKYDQNGHRYYGVYREKQRSVDLFDYVQLKEAHSDDSYFYPHEFIRSEPYGSDRSPTGLMLGGRMLLTDTDSAAGCYERRIIEQSGFLPLREQLAKAYHLRGYRRPLWIVPEDLTIARDGDDCLLSFFLPTGAYATTLLGWLFADISPKTVQRNSRGVIGSNTHSSP